ncbi:hypothetical protein H4Q26_011421 [Puccinia striiformis f. sp. tritici PST-130]|nr:hypothetical protein H4Q26_011421 [Puccinia striiformis f. sp. tritici PST-130]
MYDECILCTPKRWLDPDDLWVRPGHPSASSMATVMCAITYWWIHSQRVLQPSCGGVDPTKPEKVVTVAIYDFDTKFQCREAPNSA